MRSEFNVFWHEQLVAKISFKESGWHYDMLPDHPEILNTNRMVNGFPYYLDSIMPEWMKDPDAIEDEHAFDIAKLDGGKRYISNITILEQGKDNYPPDVMSSNNDKFCGKVFSGQLRDIVNDSRLARAMTNLESPRMSGVQLKLPVNMDEHGVVSIAHNKSFTHILKFGVAGNELQTLGAMEWVGMGAVQHAGIKTENFSLVDVDGMAAFMAERFDVRRGPEDRQSYFTEDMCSAFGYRPAYKYVGDMIEVMMQIGRQSTCAEEDQSEFFRQVFTSWVLGNSDMHLKNILMLSTYNENKVKISTRLSPAYDVICTRVYSGFGFDTPSFALSVDGNKLPTVENFERLGAKGGLKRAQSRLEMEKICSSIIDYYDNVLPQTLPDFVLRNDLLMSHIRKSAQFSKARADDAMIQLATHNRRKAFGR